MKNIIIVDGKSRRSKAKIPVREPGLSARSTFETSGCSRAVFHKQDGCFLLSSKPENHITIKNSHHYADCVQGRTSHLDFDVLQAKDTVSGRYIHQDETCLALPFVASFSNENPAFFSL